MGTTESRLKTSQDTLQEDRTKFSIGLSPSLHNKINGVPAPAPQSSMENNLSKSSDSYSINDKVQAKVNEEFLKRQKIEDYDRKCTVLDEQISNYERQLEKAVQVEENRVSLIKDYTDTIGKRQPSTPSRVPQCNSERSTFVACYKKASNEEIQSTICSDVIEDFVRCASKAQNDFVRRGMPHLPTQ